MPRRNNRGRRGDRMKDTPQGKRPPLRHARDSGRMLSAAYISKAIPKEGEQ